MGTGGSPAPKVETEGLPIVWFDFSKLSLLTGNWPSDPPVGLVCQVAEGCGPVLLAGGSVRRLQLIEINNGYVTDCLEEQSWSYVYSCPSVHMFMRMHISISKYI